MSFHSWLQNLRSVLTPGRGHPRHRRSGSPRAGTYRPHLEALEDRVTPSLIGPQLWDASSGIPSGQLGPFSGDFTSDGIVDQIYSEPHQVVVRPGHGDGTFGNAIRTYIDSPFNWGPALAVADFNNDSRLDVFTWENDPDGYGGVYSDTNYATVLLGLGNGGLDLWQTFTFYDVPQNLWIGDIGWDGHTDVIMTDGSDYGLAWINDGNWGSSEPPPPAPPHLSIDNATITEGNAGAVATAFTVTLSAASTEAITVDYVTVDGTAASGDYQAASGTLTFAPGEIEKTITVLVNGDRLIEPNETFYVNLTNASGATIADGQGVGTIINDDVALPTLTISDVSNKEGNSGTTTFSFVVTLSAPSNVPVTVQYATANGIATTANNDYTAKSGTLTFQPGQMSKTVTVSVTGDKTKEADETFFVNLSSATSGQIADGQGQGTILNDDGVSTGGKKTSAVDAAIEQLMFSSPKKRG